MLPISPNWNNSIEQPVAPSPAASCPPLSLFYSSRCVCLLGIIVTHFTLLSYEWALRLPASFPISGLARLGVKPRLCRSSWRAFAFTHPLMLPSTCSRDALLACPPFPPWNLPSFTVESTLSSPCFHCNSFFSCQGAALAHLDSLPLMIWCFEQIVLFLFLLAKAALTFLPTALSVALRPVFSVFPLKLAPFCMLFAGLGSTNKSVIFLLLSDSHSVVATLSSIFLLISNFVADLAGTLFSLLLCYQATMGPQTLVSPEKQHG